MKSPELRIGSLPPIQVRGGTLVAVLVLTVVIYPAVAPPGVATAGAVALAVGIALFMMFSVLVHEAAHAIAARAFGARVDHIALTLWGGHTQYRGDAIGHLPSTVISLAGPLSNLALAAVTYGLGNLADDGSSAASFWGLSALLNVALAVFNLLPGLPMDGGRALESTLAAITRLPLLATRITAWIGRGIAVVVVCWPLLNLIRSSQRGIGTGSLLVLLWAVLIAGVLWQGASRALESAQLQSRIEQLDVGALARPVMIVPPEQSLGQLLEVTGTAPEDLARVLVLNQRAPNPANSGTGNSNSDGSIGTGARILPNAIAGVPVSARQATPVGAVSGSIGTLAVLDEGLHGSALIAAMLARPHPAYLVYSTQGRSPGLILSADVNALLRRSGAARSRG